MDVHSGPDVSLPVRRDLTPTYASSLAIVILIAAASAAGLGYRAAVYPTDELARTFVSNDIVCLLMGLPFLLFSMALAGRGRLIGLLMWPGALLFVIYNYIGYLSAVPFSAAYLMHVALVMLSVYALVRLIAAIDGTSVRRSLAARVPGRLSAGILVGLGLAFFLRSLGVIVNAIAGGVAMTATDLSVNISDFLISPAWILGGALLWKQNEFGYVLGLGLLLGLSLLFIGLALFMLVQPALTAAPIALLDVGVVLVMGLICFVPCFLFARGAASSRGAFTT